MSLAFDSKSQGSTAISTTSLTISHTCTGSELILVVSFSVDNSDGTSDPTSVTYNGVSMTKGSTRVSTIASNRQSWNYYLANPTLGTNNIIITFAVNRFISAGGISYTGASGSIGTNTGGNSGNTTTPTVSITTTANNSVLVSSFYQNNAALTLTDNALQNQRFKDSSPDGFAEIGSTKAVTSIGSTTMDWTQSGASGAPNDWNITVIEILSLASVISPFPTHFRV